MPAAAEDGRAWAEEIPALSPACPWHPGKGWDNPSCCRPQPTASAFASHSSRRCSLLSPLCRHAWSWLSRPALANPNLGAGANGENLAILLPSPAMWL